LLLLEYEVVVVDVIGGNDIDVGVIALFVVMVAMLVVEQKCE